MSENAQWLVNLDKSFGPGSVDGLVAVHDFHAASDQLAQAAVMLKAKEYGADAVFFEAGRNGRPATPQAFVFISDGPADDPDFARLHRRLWSWGGVPLLYRKTHGLVQLFRCAHKPDFLSETGERCNPFKTLNTLAKISSDPWWDHWRLRNGTIWDDPKICGQLMSDKSAHKLLLSSIKELNDELNEEGILRKHLRRKLLILSLLIAYLEEREVLLPDFFSQFLPDATKFFEVLANGEALVAMLEALEVKFNGNVFRLEPEDAASLRNNGQLAKFALMVQAKQEKSGQRTLWELYSFKDLPIELISHIYQMFVEDKDTAIYTPPFLVRLMLDEVLSWNRLDRLIERGEVIADFSCGSGVFLVEAYKRLVLHWRSRNNWNLPSKTDLNRLLKRVHGVDLETGAVELTAFSLYLAMCDALEPEEIRSSIRLFPPLEGVTLHKSCFFEAREKGLVKEPIGVVVGNPPFKSKLTTEGAKRSYARYEEQHGRSSLADKQLAYLFLNDAMEMTAAGGVLCMLQQYNFLFNQKSHMFRRQFFARWDVREILDFISVRGLFKNATKAHQEKKGDTKIVVILAENAEPASNREILHATFRRSNRVTSEQGFDVDYYDLHWLPRHFLTSDEADHIWRANLLGGGRSFHFVERLRKYRTLASYAAEEKWDFGEGFIEAKPRTDETGEKAKKLSAAEHLTHKPLLPEKGITTDGIDRSTITTVTATLFKTQYTSARFSAPMTLVHQQFDLNHGYMMKGYLTYKNQIVGFCGSKAEDVRAISDFLIENKRALRAFVACISVKLFTQHATTLSAADIFSLPYPAGGRLDLSSNEQIIADDIVDFYRDFIRLGDKSPVAKSKGFGALQEFARVFTSQINAIYKKSPLRVLDAQVWPGIICQPFVFGAGKVDWTDAESLQEKLDKLLHEQKGSSLHVTRIARIYDGRFIFMLKPDRLRFWLRSIALRDADETLADLRKQGF